ncbi:hypothetical protein BGW80DRAFT_1455141 [Lactifluus volemus]|nr:hypothetical protein BGW80DRAFT_1455141 [Lactifluus volemus]
MPLFKLPDMAPGQVRYRSYFTPSGTTCYNWELPDNVLLDIFQICVPHLDLSPGSYPRRPKTWYHLVHYSCEEKLDVWPPLPIKIWSTHAGDLGDNIIAALEHPDRICDETGETAPALSNTFLGGSAPRLRSLTLYHIPFPTLPQLLLSCNDLSRLSLRNIPHNGYISPAAMVRGISTLTRLTHLNIGFESSASRPDQRTRRPPLLTRTVLPALTAFKFCGVSEYLDDLVAQIDAPLLEDVDITLFNQLIFDIRHLPQFIGRTPRFISCKKAEMVFDDDNVVISLLPAMRTLLPSRLKWKSDAEEIERLNIQGYTNLLESTLQIDMDNTQWLELLDPFIAAQTLRIPRVFRSSITSALEGLRGESASEVLPALADLYLERYQTSGSEQQDIEPFITARQRSSHPVSVHLFPFPRPPSTSPQSLSRTQTDIEGIGYSYSQAYDSLLSHYPNATSRARPDGPDGPEGPDDPDGRAKRQLNETYDSRPENEKPSRSRGSKSLESSLIPNRSSIPPPLGQPLAEEIFPEDFTVAIMSLLPRVEARAAAIQRMRSRRQLAKAPGRAVSSVANAITRLKYRY